MAITTWSRPLRWAAAWACALCALAGCGGGGGGGDSDSPLSGTVQLEGVAELGVAASIRTVPPEGAQGTPRCSLVSGTVPPGMVFGTDCSLAGTPTQVGEFASQLSFTVPGRAGSATVNVQIVIDGPVLFPFGPLPDTLRLLVALPSTDVVAVFGQVAYAPRAGDVITFAVASGSLPPGLTLDAATGKISGTPSVVGTFDALLGATLRRNGQDYALNTVRVAKTVVAPFGNITYDARCCDLKHGVAVPMQTLAPTFSPALPAGATARFESTAALPAGLALDPATGIISGRTLLPGTYPLGMRATVTTAQGAVFPLELAANIWRLNIQGVLPRYDGSSNCGARLVFDPFETEPASVIFNVVRLAVCTMSPGTVFAGQAGDAYRFALTAHPSTGQTPPPWVSVDPLSGVVSVAVPASVPVSPPGQGTPVIFGLQVTTTRGAETIVSRQGWALMVQ